MKLVGGARAGYSDLVAASVIDKRYVQRLMHVADPVAQELERGDLTPGATPRRPSSAVRRSRRRTGRRAPSRRGSGSQISGRAVRRGWLQANHL